MDEDNKEQSSAPGSPRSPNELDSRYGKIGISAVAAAVRCQPDQRRPASSKRFASDSE
ncbi:hypothetical protein [Pseudolabrys taiwanensis]|uniref:hypothetical protein n=1 Tax=Pseudolabrys taiwanensis TaxID=331696 RepID=UPI0013B3A54E|nr:hypothetical protein [Pseudolabrys taiwanensis]